MFCRARKILDPFIPIDNNSGKKAMELANCRAWGGRKIQVQLSKYKQAPSPAQQNGNVQRKNDNHINP